MKRNGHPSSEPVLMYAARGWQITPLNGKIPFLRNWPEKGTTNLNKIRSYLRKGQNVGIITGEISGLLVLDEDPRHGGDESLRKLEAQYGPLPATPRVRTGSGGHHYYFQHPKNVVIHNSAGKLGVGLDIKTTKGQVVAPPSIHPETKQAYEWDRAYHPDGVPLAPAPTWLLEKLQHTDASPRNDASKANPTGDKIPAGERNDFLYRLGRSLKAKGLSDDAIRAALHAENQAKCDPICDEDGIERVLKSVLNQADRVEFISGSVTDRLDKLRALSTNDLKATWMTYARGLSAEDHQTVLMEIARLTGLGINTLKAMIREEQEKRKQQAAKERIGDRTVILYRPEDVCAIAREVEAAMLLRLADGECVRFSDNVVRVAIQTLPHSHQADSDLPAVPTAQFDLMTPPKLLPLTERAVVLEVETPYGFKSIAVPRKILDQILVNPHDLPTVTGLLAHPLVTRAGRIILASGIDPSTRLLLYGPQLDGLRTYSKDEALKGAEEIVKLLLDGFEFATPLDKTAALALLLTAIERKLMDMSPGFLITAAQQSLGKTTLARLIHLILTGTDAPIFTWPDDDDVEVQKLLLSTLLRSPEIVTFDNIGDGLTFRSPALSSAMTSATKQGRLLGHNRDAVVSTSVVFVLTGNNVTLANDEASRIIPIRLITQEVSPHKRTFTYPDVMRRALEIREPVLRHAIGLIAGYLTSGERVTGTPSRFPQWDVLVRHPLIWAGLEDVGTVFDQNIEASPELGAHLALLRHLRNFYDENEFSASDLVVLANPRRGEGSDEWYGPEPILREALLALRVKDIKSERSIGHALARVLGRNAVITQEYVLYLDRTTKNGLSRYRVKTRGGKGDLDDRKPQ
ncbi:MAG: hypothetical protein E8D42_14280 [Nitrospira sp.]|nr:MAG: hypothetical protein E8D42_14280 [Nitrospira sp.]